MENKLFSKIEKIKFITNKNGETRIIVGLIVFVLVVFLFMFYKSNFIVINTILILILSFIGCLNDLYLFKNEIFKNKKMELIGNKIDFYLVRILGIWKWIFLFAVLSLYKDTNKGDFSLMGFIEWFINY